MYQALLAFGVSTALAAASLAPNPAESRETILFLRHGEKPIGGLGQLSCQGLNRALALPAVLRRKYGRIDAVFAPNPAQEKPDGTGDDGNALRYDYVRPLATAEPTAIAFGLPIETAFGFSDIDKLQAALLAPTYRDATILVVWEHHALNKLVPALLTSLGAQSNEITPWKKSDFDSIWRVTIDRQEAKTIVGFARDSEGLDGQPSTCP
jgi:hypothetical protein